MSREHVVRQGECLSSIAFEYGLHPATIWNHPNNAKLKKCRESATILNQQDVVFIPDLTPKNVDKPTDAVHTFIRRGLPETLRIRFLDAEDKPRANLKYTLLIDGNFTHGVTDSEGFLKAVIPPDAMNGKIVLDNDREHEEYLLKLGYLPPITEMTGIQARLSNLGYFCKSDNGEFGALTRQSIALFQREHDLEPTGEVDDRTRAAIKRVYGS